MRAWVQVAHAHSTCVDVVPLTGWRAFAETGDPDEEELGKAGRSRGSLRTNLGRSARYAENPWPAAYGERDLARDVAARGVFEDLWASAFADVSAGALRPCP